MSAMENAGKEDMPDEAERKGLGTPATRAAIIEKLVSGGFVECKGKNLIPTKAGVNLVTVLPELLTSPKLTADWEQRLNEVAKGQASPEDFMDGIEAMAAELVRKYSHISEDGQKLFQPEKEAGQPVQPLTQRQLIKSLEAQIVIDAERVKAVDVVRIPYRLRKGRAAAGKVRLIVHMDGDAIADILHHLGVQPKCIQKWPGDSGAVSAVVVPVIVCRDIHPIGRVVKQSGDASRLRVHT